MNRKTLAEQLSSAVLDHSESLDPVSFEPIKALIRNDYHSTVLQWVRVSFLLWDGYDDAFYAECVRDLWEFFHSAGSPPHKLGDDEKDEWTPDEIANANAWVQAFKSHSKTPSGASGKSSTKLPYSTEKVEVKFEKFDGSPGKAADWWQSTLKQLKDLQGDSSDPSVRSRWCSMIKTQLTKKTTKQLFDQLKKRHTGADGIVDLDKLMDVFVSKHDIHAEENCYVAYERLKQTNNQSMLDFYTEFEERAEALVRAGYGLTDHQKWIGFKTKTKFADQIYKNPAKCDNIEHSVDFLSAFEEGKNGNGKRSNLNVVRPKGRRTRRRKRKNGGKVKRCFNCHRSLDYHSRRDSGIGKNCPYPKTTLAKQLDWEKRNKIDVSSKLSSIESLTQDKIDEMVARSVAKTDFTCVIPSKEEKKSAALPGVGRKTMRIVTQSDDEQVFKIFATGARSSSAVVLTVRNSANSSTGNEKVLSEKLNVPSVSDEPVGSSAVSRVKHCVRDVSDLSARDPGVLPVDPSENVLDFCSDLPIYDSDDEAINYPEAKSVSQVHRIAKKNHLRLERKNPPNRKIAMTMVKFRVAGTDARCETSPCLWDTGSTPDSYISLNSVRSMGMEGKITGPRSVHNQAEDGASFESLGDINLELHFHNGSVVVYPFKVATISTEMIIGWDLMEQLGAVVSVKTKKIHLAALGKLRLQMISVNNWTNVSRITSQDFMKDKIPLPGEFQRAFPGKNLREIAEELDSIPSAQDLTIEHGRKIISNLLANEYKEIGVPRKLPTPYIKPGKIRFKEGYDDVVINVPPRSRPTLEHEQIEQQVKQWAAAGKVEKSNSPFNSPIVVAPKATPPYYRIAIDYRRVNEISEPFKHPMRKLDDMAEEISRKKIKSTMDNDQAYTQIPIWKPHRGRTAFTSRGSKWHFVCFPHAG